MLYGGCTYATPREAAHGADWWVRRRSPLAALASGHGSCQGHCAHRCLMLLPSPLSSLLFFIHGEDYEEYQVPELMTAERKAQLAAHGGLAAVRCFSVLARTDRDVGRVANVHPARLLPSSPPHQYLDALKAAADAKQDERFRKGSSKFRGVTCDKRNRERPWVMSIRLGGALRQQLYSSEEEAARAYDQHVMRRDGRCAVAGPRLGIGGWPGRSGGEVGAALARYRHLTPRCSAHKHPMNASSTPLHPPHPPPAVPPSSTLGRPRATWARGPASCSPPLSWPPSTRRARRASARPRRPSVRAAWLRWGLAGRGVSA